MEYQLQQLINITNALLTRNEPPRTTRLEYNRKEHYTVDNECIDCEFFAPGAAVNKDGICRLNPPTVTADGKSYWAEVSELDWCSKFLLKKA